MCVDLVEIYVLIIFLLCCVSFSFFEIMLWMGLSCQIFAIKADFRIYDSDEVQDVHPWENTQFSSWKVQVWYAIHIAPILTLLYWSLQCRPNPAVNISISRYACRGIARLNRLLTRTKSGSSPFTLYKVTFHGSLKGRLCFWLRGSSHLPLIMLKITRLFPLTCNMNDFLL